MKFVAFTGNSVAEVTAPANEYLEREGHPHVMGWQLQTNGTELAYTLVVLVGDSQPVATIPP